MGFARFASDGQLEVGACMSLASFLLPASGLRHVFFFLKISKCQIYLM